MRAPIVTVQYARGRALAGPRERIVARSLHPRRIQTQPARSGHRRPGQPRHCHADAGQHATPGRRLATRDAWWRPTLPKSSPDPAKPTRARTTRASDGADTLFDSLRRVLRELRLAGRDAERRVGLHAAELDVLHHLSRERAGSLSELASRTHTDLSSVSVVARRLAERGLVARETAPDDARRLVIALTAAGRATLRRSPESARDRLERVAARLSSREQRQLADALARLADALGDDANGGARRGRGSR